MLKAGRLGLFAIGDVMRTNGPEKEAEAAIGSVTITPGAVRQSFYDGERRTARNV